MFVQVSFDAVLWGGGQEQAHGLSESAVTVRLPLFFGFIHVAPHHHFLPEHILVFLSSITFYSSMLIGFLVFLPPTEL